MASSAASTRRPATTRAMVTRVVASDAATRRPDVIVSEEPLEIRLLGLGMGTAARVTTTMRTPGNDFELAAGFIFTEGLWRRPDSLREVRYCVCDGDTQQYNIVTAEIAEAVDASLLRRSEALGSPSSSCGICGTNSIDDLERCTTPIPPDRLPAVTVEVLLGLPAVLARSQPVFARTGGVHGAGLFDAAGSVLAVREDVGRHNAVDKAIGAMLLSGRHRSLSDAVLLVSGRVSFEIVQKAAMAGIAMLAGVGAPTSLAVDAAESLAITLAGFVGTGSANLYTRPERLT